MDIKLEDIIIQLAKDYNLNYEQALEIIRVQRELAKYKTTYKAK